MTVFAHSLRVGGVWVGEANTCVYIPTNDYHASDPDVTG